MLRRNLLKTIGMGVAVVTLSQRDSLQAFVEGKSLSDAPWWLLSPLKAGNSVGKGWKITDLSTVEQGACILSLEHTSGDVTNIHICAKEEGQKGIESTALLDLVIMDGRQGQEDTREDIGRVVMGLAKRIQRNEMKLEADLLSLSSLQSHNERVNRYGPENLL
tara:strand:- start:370 stop:858 length:489 start_codon:yes stop_codon:yes gene_type:complete